MGGKRTLARTFKGGRDLGLWEQLQSTSNHGPRFDCCRCTAAFCGRQFKDANLVILYSAGIALVHEAYSDLAEIVWPPSFASCGPRLLVDAFEFCGTYAPQQLPRLRGNFSRNMESLLPANGFTRAWPF